MIYGDSSRRKIAHQQACFSFERSSRCGGEERQRRTWWCRAWHVNKNLFLSCSVLLTTFTEDILDAARPQASQNRLIYEIDIRWQHSSSFIYKASESNASHFFTAHSLHARRTQPGLLHANCVVFTPQTSRWNVSIMSTFKSSSWLIGRVKTADITQRSVVIDGCGIVMQTGTLVAQREKPILRRN